MTIDELEDKSLDLVIDIKNEDAHWDSATKLSIQFTIEALEECLNKYTPEENIKAGIKQLKQYLDEKV